MKKQTLMIDATEGITSETQTEINSMIQEGVDEIEILLKNTNEVEDDDLIELLEKEVRELLTSNGFDGDHATINRA